MSGVTRRQVLVWGAAGAGVVAIGATGAIVTSLVTTAPTGEPVSPTATPDGSVGPDAWPAPVVLESSDGLLDLDLEVSSQTLTLDGSAVSMFAYNGTVPGPTLHLRPGDVLRVHLRNGLADATNLHTHGLVVSSAGASDNPFIHIGPGESFDYEIRLPEDHPSGVFWYHPHHHGMVADQLFAGLYGAIIVDDEDWSTHAPRVVVISDTTIVGGAVATVTAGERMMGRTGELLLVNGAIAPRLSAPAGASQRLLIVNACASRYLDLDLTGLSAQLRGYDSGHGTPRAVDRLLLVPGSRADVVITTPAEEVGVVSQPVDRGSAGMGAMGGAGATPSPVIAMTVAPDESQQAHQVPDAPAETHRDLRAVAVDGARTITLGMTMGMGQGGMQFLIDGREFDPERVDIAVSIGTVEEWTITNTSTMNHPFHLHVWPMQIVSIDGVPVDGLDVRDVIDVSPNGSVVVRIAFDRFPGRAVYHCHILDHEDLGMMGVIEGV